MAARDSTSCVSVPPVCYKADLQLCQEMPLDLQDLPTSKFLKCHGKDSFSVRWCDIAHRKMDAMDTMQTSLIVAQKVHSIMATMHHIQHTRGQSTIAGHFSKHHGLKSLIVVLPKDVCWWLKSAVHQLIDRYVRWGVISAHTSRVICAQTIARGHLYTHEVWSHTPLGF